MDQKNQNWSFEVVTIPQQDNALELPSSPAKTTPVKVKIRMKKANKKGAPRHGVISMPKMTSTIENTERIRVVHSDQTIMSFNMLMETDTKSKSYHKQQNKFFHLFKSGKCFGTQDEDESDPPYVRATRVLSDEVKTDRSPSVYNKKNKLSETKYDSKCTKQITNAPVFLGKCKPGGCLDPPFGEDKYEYRPSAHEKLDMKEKENSRSIAPDKTELKSDITDKTLSSAPKIESQEPDINSTCMLYNATSKISLLHDKQSDSIITYPPEISSERIGLSGKSIIRKTSAATSKTSSELTDTYFMPPKINYRKTSNKNNDNKDEITYVRKSEDIANSEYKETDLLLQESNLVTGISNVSGTMETIKQSERKLSQIVGIPESITQNNQIKVQPPYLRTEELNELNVLENIIFYSQGKSQSVNSFLDNLQQSEVESLKITKKEKPNAGAVNNTSNIDKITNAMDNSIFLPAPVKNTLREYNGDELKLKHSANFEKETNKQVIHAVSENITKSSFSNKNLKTYTLNEVISTKGSISEINAHTTLQNMEDKIIDIHSNHISVTNSDKLTKLPDNVSLHNKLGELSTLDSFRDVQSTSSKIDVTRKENIVDETFKKKSDELQSLTAELQSTEDNDSQCDNKLQAYSSNENKKNNIIENANEFENISQTSFTPNLQGNKEKLSKMSLHDLNKYKMQVNKSQSMDLNVNKNIEDLNKMETITNISKHCDEVNENLTEISDHINVNVMSDVKSKPNQTLTGIESTLSVIHKIASRSFERLELENQENKFSSKCDNNKIVSMNSTNKEGNNVETLDSMKREKLEVNENELYDNIVNTKDVSLPTSEMKLKTSDSVISNQRTMPIQNEIYQTEQIEDTTEIKADSFPQTKFLRNGDTGLDENSDNIIEKDNTVKQENTTEKVRVSHLSNDLPYNYNAPFNTEIITSVENTPIKTGTQKIHIEKDGETGDVKQKFKLISSRSTSNLSINKEELSITDSLNSHTIQLSNIKNDVKLEEFDTLQQRDVNVESYGKKLSYSSEIANNYTKIRVNAPFNTEIITSVENSPIKTGTQKIDIEKNGDTGDVKQKFKLISSRSTSNLSINKEELSLTDSLNSHTIQLSNMKNDLRIEEFDMLLQRDVNVESYGKKLSYSSEIANDYTKIRVNQDTKNEIPMSLDNKKLSQVTFRDVATKTIILDLGFQMYLSDNKETILKTFDVSKKPARMLNDSISVIKSVLNLSDNNKLLLAINSETKLTIEINKNNGYIQNEERTLKIKDASDDDFTQHSYIDNKHHISVKSINSLQKSLGVIYENDLVPVAKLIRNLIVEIDSISKYRSLTKKKSIASKKMKVSKPTYYHRRCGCSKK